MNVSKKQLIESLNSPPLIDISLHLTFNYFCDLLWQSGPETSSNMSVAQAQFGDIFASFQKHFEMIVRNCLTTEIQFFYKTWHVFENKLN